MRYGFDARGGFVAVDDERRVAAYAQPDTANTRRATADAEATAAGMLDLAGFGPAHLVEDHYQRMTSLLWAANR